jgi:hypothetical protein
MDNKFKAVFNRKTGKMVWRKINKGEDEVAAPPPEAANAASSPSTVLGLNIGSG